MAVFISYSHQDKDFVTALAANLVRRNVHIWLDTWEINVGDSLLNKVQLALEQASAIIVVLSETSVKSNWVNKELNSGLMRELEEKRVIILPVLVDNCTIPLFLKEKKYADFRLNFDEGLENVFDGISKVINSSLGRIVHSNYHTDWSIDWRIKADGLFLMDINMVDHADNIPYTVLTKTTMYANKTATEYFQLFNQHGLGWVAEGILLDLINEMSNKGEMRLILEDQKQKEHTVDFKDTSTEFGFILSTTSRRMGEDNGKDILVNYGGQLRNVYQANKSTMRKLTHEEYKLVNEIASIFRIEFNNCFRELQ